MNQKPKSKGAILLITTILLFVILGMVVSLTYVTVMEQKMSQKTKSSVGSFYNSESGIEWTLNKIANSSGAIGGSTAFSTYLDPLTGKVTCPSLGNGNTCEVYLLDQDGKVINNTNPNTTPAEDISMVKAVRSIGSEGGNTQRAIEAAVASDDCPLSAYFHATTTSYNGSAVGGYSGGNAKCAVAYPGSRMCMAADFVCGLPTANGWYNTFLIDIGTGGSRQDCQGWSYSGGGYSGSMWQADPPMPSTSACSASLPLLCCK